jgi:excisionase family DNA binding protein
MHTQDELLTPQLAAAVLGIRAATLANWRTTKSRAIPYVKVGRSVRYRRSDLEAWIASRRIDGGAV